MVEQLMAHVICHLVPLAVILWDQGCAELTPCRPSDLAFAALVSNRPPVSIWLIGSSSNDYVAEWSQIEQLLWLRAFVVAL